MKFIAAVCFAFAVLAASAPAEANAINLVVVEVRGLDLQPGQAIDGSKPLVLVEGQRIVAVSPTGRIVTLRGPLDRAPIGDERADKGDMSGALNALITQKIARTDKAGVVRGGEKQLVPPEPWLLDVSRSGTRCLPQNSVLALWRPDAAGSGTVSVSPSDRSWRARMEWAAGDERVVLQHQVPVAGRAVYMVKLGDHEVTLTLIGLPETLETDAMRVAWMSEKGCDGQAMALLNGMRQAAGNRTR